MEVIKEDGNRNMNIKSAYKGRNGDNKEQNTQDIIEHKEE